LKIFLAKNFVGKILLQISGSGSVDPPVVNTGTIADNIKNPTTFYNVDNKPSNTTYRNMWDAQQTGTDLS
jgi:hypothetical protein